MFVEVPWFIFVLLIGELVVAIVFTARLKKMQPMTANILFYVYAALTGFSLSTVGLAYDVSTVFEAFLFAAVLFASCVVIGHTTRVDLSKFSGILIGGLIALVLVSLLEIFVFHNTGLNLIISYVGVVLFLFITAWDMQKIKAYYAQLDGYQDMKSKMAVYSAFQLYLDFINIFLYVLRILGSRSRN